LAFPYQVDRRLGEGSDAVVWLANTPDGPVALKIGKDPLGLADEAERLLFVGSIALVQVLDAGTVPSGVEQLSAGRPYLALEWAAGAAIDPRTKLEDRDRLALVVARDVGLAISDLHAAGTAHGDVKPANIVFDEATSSARLVDLGLSASADDPTPKGATPRYLAPETLDPRQSSDGRTRDLWALGLSIAEIANENLAQDADPAASVHTAEFSPPIAQIVAALTAPTPGARASAQWVARAAAAALGTEEPPERVEARRQSAVERAYLAVRRREILSLASKRDVQVDLLGMPADWLTRAVSIAQKVARLRGESVAGTAGTLRPLDELGRARWLVHLIGAPAASWPIPDLGDAELAERFLALCQTLDPASFTLAAIQAGTHADEAPLDPVGVALALGRGVVSRAILDRAEDFVRSRAAGPDLALELARHLRLAGDLGRALSVLSLLDSPEAHVEAAEALRRSGDMQRAIASLELVPEAGGVPSTRARRIATLARIELDAGRQGRARELLERAPLSAPTLETLALAELAEGRLEQAAVTARRGLAMAENEEQRARLEAASGFVAHAAGDSDAAAAAYRRAEGHAVRAGAVLEEATYLTGKSAAAANVGDLTEALAASRRAILLFEHLGRPRDAARAALSRATVFAQAGAVAEASEAASDAISRARAADDRRCRAYAHFALADVLPDADPDGVEHADRALALLSDSSHEDQVHAAARCLRRGKRVEQQRFDQLARSDDVGVEAKLEWWGARAFALGRAEQPVGAELVVSELGALANARAPLKVKGATLAAGANLAARVGDGDAARRLAFGARDAARELMRRATPELRQSMLELAWVKSIQAPRESTVSSDQLTDIETLVHALGRRDRLRPLLDQVLDALILWTGVERGLLLLRAPGNKLVPRAARNIARSDLGAEQLSLSTSLAERAAAEKEPVVAVDAAVELPDLYASVHALKLRSVLAVPLLARGEVLGVVYLDDRVRRGAFGPSELSWVRLVAALASVAIADARDQLLLRRAARRARRAEARLGVELARREAELDVAERELARTRDARDTRFRYDEIVGESEPLRALLALVDRVAVSDVPVLVAGESGSGKELIARAIHENSSRAGRPFVGENCGAIPEGLLESTLFGHVRGAFTGASRPRAGLFEVADGGSLFLDEIGEMSLGMQTKLLRVLEDGEVRAVGSERARKVDVRVIGATNRDLEALAKAGSFRQDLLYRLNVIKLTVPPLRERGNDIPILIRHFLGKHAQKGATISKPALDLLCAYDWPGNVRQLENEIRRAIVLSDRGIEPEHLSPEVLGQGRKGARPESELDLRFRVDALAADLVKTALERTDGNQTRAAELLGLSRFGLQKMIRRLEIDATPGTGRRSVGVVGKAR
jgi:transcriptional regulator with GAF, ATPase, and Fis domain/tetratricopeptide (TPR) repeat protein